MLLLIFQLLLFVNTNVDSFNRYLANGDSLFISKNTSQAHEEYIEALKLAESLNDKNLKFRALEKLLNLFAVNDAQERLWENYLDRLKDNVQSEHDSLWYYYHRTRISLQYGYRLYDFQVERPIDFEEYLNRTKEIKDLDLELRFRSIYAIYSELTLQNLQKAAKLYQKNLEQIRLNSPGLGDKYLFSNTANLGDLYLSNGEYPRAIELFKEALSSDRKESMVYENLSRINKWLSQAYQLNGQVDSALHYLNIAHQINIKADRLTHNHIIDELEEKYQNEKLSSSLAFQKIRLTRSRYVLGLSVIAIGFLFYFFYQKRKESKLLKTKIYNERLLVEQKMRIEAVSAKVAGEEQERKRVARILHDQVSGYLSAAQIQLNTILVKDLSDQPLSLIKEASGKIRSLSHELYPPILLSSGLAGAIRDLIDDYNSKNLKFEFETNVDDLINLPELALYDIIRELINNVLKHSDADNCKIFLNHLKDELFISIRDNGAGILYHSIKKDGMGSAIINRHLLALGGVMTVESEGKGYNVMIRIPHS